jgi:hypothetical protein
MKCFCAFVKLSNAIHQNRIPRVAKLMALAIHFDELIRSGVVADQTELARIGHVTSPRVTQIMNLLCLAPDIRETLLFMSPIVSGRLVVPTMTKHLAPGTDRPSDCDRAARKV